MPKKKKVVKKRVGPKKTLFVASANEDLENYKNKKIVNDAMEMPKELTPKQLLFIQYYITSKNATDSYMKAFGATTRNSAGVCGYSLLRHSKIRRIVEQAFAAENRKIALSKEKVIARLEEFALHGPRDKIATLCLEMLNKYFKLYEMPPKDPSNNAEEDLDDAYEFIKPKVTNAKKD